MSLFSGGNSSSSMFSEIIEYQGYMDSRKSTIALSDMNVKRVEEMSEDMSKANKLQRLAQWQKMYQEEIKSHKDDADADGARIPYTTTLAEYIAEFTAILESI